MFDTAALHLLLPVFGDTTADAVFAHLIYIAWPATALYPVVYGWVARKVWWKTWIGRALMMEALGVFTLITFSALYQLFGPDYPGRDFIRLSGMTFSALGFWMVLLALVKVQIDVRAAAKTGDLPDHPMRRATDHV